MIMINIKFQFQFNNPEETLTTRKLEIHNNKTIQAIACFCCQSANKLQVTNTQYSS